MVFTFSALGQKTPFWANLFNKIKIFSLSENLVPGLIWICGIRWWCSLSVFDWKYLRQIWSKKSKLSVWAEISHIRLIWICRISCVHFLWFWPEKPFFGKSGQNCQFKLKFGTKINLNMQMSMMVFTFSVFEQICFFGKFGPKIQNCLFKVKIDTNTNSNMQSSMAVSILSVLDWK